MGWDHSTNGKIQSWRKNGNSWYFVPWIGRHHLRWLRLQRRKGFGRYDHMVPYRDIVDRDIHSFQDITFVRDTFLNLCFFDNSVFLGFHTIQNSKIWGGGASSRWKIPDSLTLPLNDGLWDCVCPSVPPIIIPNGHGKPSEPSLRADEKSIVPLHPSTGIVVEGSFFSFLFFFPTHFAQKSNPWHLLISFKTGK